MRRPYLNASSWPCFIYIEKVNALLKYLEEIDKLLHENIQASINPEDVFAHRKFEAALGMEISNAGIAKGLGNSLRTHHSQHEGQVSKADLNFRRAFDSYSALPLSSQEKQWLEETIRLFHQVVSLSRGGRGD